MKKAEDYAVPGIMQMKEDQYGETPKAYYQIVGDVVPTIEGLAIYLGISRETVYAWEKENPEFSDITENLRALQGNLLINGALGNKFNPTISKLLLSSKHGYVEKSEVDQTINGSLATGEIDPEVGKRFGEFMKQDTKQ